MECQFTAIDFHVSLAGPISYHRSIKFLGRLIFAKITASRILNRFTVPLMPPSLVFSDTLLSDEAISNFCPTGLDVLK